MNTKIDTKSVGIGLALGVLITVAVAAATSPGNQVGRYQIVSNPNNGGQGGSHSLVLDTVTGRVWLGYVPSGVGSDPQFLQPKSVE